MKLALLLFFYTLISVNPSRAEDKGRTLHAAIGRALDTIVSLDISQKVRCAFVSAPMFKDPSKPIDLKTLEDWAPRSDANCANAALLSSGKMTDVFHVDPNLLAEFIIPLCFREKSSAGPETYVVGTAPPWGVWHVYYLGKDGRGFNKDGTGEDMKFKTESAAELMSGMHRQLMDYYPDAASRSGGIKFYEDAKKTLCPLSNMEEKFRKHIKEPEFYQVRGLIRARIESRNSNLIIENEMSRNRLKELSSNYELRARLFKEFLARDYRKIANKKKVQLKNDDPYSALPQLLPEILDPNLVEQAERAFYNALAAEIFRQASTPPVF